MKILLATIGSYGDLNPYLGLGRALEADGHHAVLAVASAYRRHVEEAGLEYRPMRPEGDPADPDLVARVMDPMRGAEFLIRDLLMPRLREMYDDLEDATRDIDVVVSHPLTMAAPILCEKRGLPWAASVLAPMSFFSRLDPPLAVPHRTVAGLHRRWPWISKPINAIGRQVAQTWVRAARDLRASLGLPKGRNPLFEGQFSPHLNLGLFSRLLAGPQDDWPPRTFVTGAVRYDAVRGGMPEDLGRFLDDGPPPVVFTLGSSAVSLKRARFFFDVGAAAASALGRRAVLLTGFSGSSGSSGSSGPSGPSGPSGSVFVAEWAPHSMLFHRAAAVVHQGGAGTLHTALAAGRPMVVVPFAFDQPDNAVRAQRLGVARVIYPGRYTAGSVSRALETLLGDPDVADRAAQVAAVVGEEDGARMGTGLISTAFNR